MLARDAFSRWLGVEVLAVRAGHCELRMTVRDEMINGFGVAHGGIAYSLADSAMAFACNSGDRVTVALDTSMSYPAAIRAGDVLIATADEEAESRKLGYYRVPVRNQNDIVVALFRGTVYRTNQLHSKVVILSPSTALGVDSAKDLHHPEEHS
jgi:acyl-CoA thioesterase